MRSERLEPAGNLTAGPGRLYPNLYVSDQQSDDNDDGSPSFRRRQKATDDAGRPSAPYIDQLGYEPPGSRQEEYCARPRGTSDEPVSCIHAPAGIGPMSMSKPRPCRDVLCIILFVLAWIAWLALGWVVFTQGCPDNCNDPRLLVCHASLCFIPFCIM